MGAWLGIYMLLIQPGWDRCVVFGNGAFMLCTNHERMQALSDEKP
jgi:hypothetical protein